MLTEEEYKKYAAARLKINQTIADKFTEQKDIKKAGQALGVHKKGIDLLNNETAQSATIDFAIRYVKRNGQTALDRAIENEFWNNEFEEVYLKGQKNPVASLFQLVSTDPATNSLVYRDILNSDNNDITVIDIGAANYLKPGILMYMPLVPIEDVYITNGISFGYDPRYNDIINFELNKPANRSKLKDEDKAFKFFFKLFQKMGATMQGADIK